MNNNILFYLPRLSIYEDRIKTLIQVKKNIIFFVFIYNDNLSLTELIKSNGHKVIFLSEFIPIKVIRLILQPFLILLLALYYNCKIVHLTSYVVNPLIAFLFCKLFKKKYFVSLYIVYASRFKLFKGLTLRQKLQSKQIQRMYLFSLHEFLLLPLVDNLIMQAKGLANELPFYYIFRKKVKIIMNGISPSNKKWELKNKNFSESNLKILFIGGIDFTRGVDKLIKVVSNLNNKGYKVELSLVGNVGDYFQIFLDKFQNKNIKLFAKKKRTEMFDFVLEHDIFIYPTLNEGSPRVILELAMIGIPIIASRHPGIIQLDENNMFINFINDNNDVENYIKDYLKDQKPFLEKASYGRHYVLKNNNFKKISKQYENYYK